ncbi:MAG: thioredoxin [Chloroflexi bacterium RBG_16_63_12]|jgi:thioredoxin 1|nr:MAG: thioredoxin [Chloroflexi bacterium RBG_16_63_12]
MATMHQFSDATFRQEVLESDRPVLVDFTAEWCGPCHMLAPVVEKLNDEWNGVVKVGKLDIDVNVETTMQYGVMGVPTLILFKSGQPAERLMGFMPKERLLAKLNPHLK